MGTRKTNRAASNNAGKTRGKPFEAGNKKGRGRPAGSRNKATVMLEKLMADDGKAVVQKIIKVAKGGDMAAARMIVDRIVPLRKGRPVEFSLPAVETAADVLAAQAAVIEAMSRAQLTPEEAALVAKVIDGKRQAIELMDIEARLARLEQKRGR